MVVAMTGDAVETTAAKAALFKQTPHGRGLCRREVKSVDTVTHQWFAGDMGFDGDIVPDSRKEV